MMMMQLIVCGDDDDMIHHDDHYHYRLGNSIDADCLTTATTTPVKRLRGLMDCPNGTPIRLLWRLLWGLTEDSTGLAQHMA